MLQKTHAEVMRKAQFTDFTQDKVTFCHGGWGGGGGVEAPKATVLKRRFINHQCFMTHKLDHTLQTPQVVHDYLLQSRNLLLTIHNVW